MKPAIFSNPNFLRPEFRANLPETINHIEMSYFESSFLAGLLCLDQPKNILEVGVSAGGTTALILNVLSSLNNNAHLNSVDLNEKWYVDKQKETGYLAKQMPYDNWQLHTGKYLPEVIDNLPHPFDFCILDTVHSLPGELLDFLVLLPYMKLNSILVLHDINLFFIGQHFQRDSFSNKILYDNICGEKIYTLDTETNQLPNIGAVRITEDTIKYINNVFYSFAMAWVYIPNENEFNIYYNFFKKTYGEKYADYFLLAFNQNKELLSMIEKEKNIQPIDLSKNGTNEVSMRSFLINSAL